MPVRFLTDAERERLGSFPQEIPEEDLYAFFTLTGPDFTVIPNRSAPANRLGFALSLCAVRFLGFCPEDLSSAPRAVTRYVGDQIGVPVEALEGYAARGQTRTDHLVAIHAHLGFRRPTPDDLITLSVWLVGRALEHDAPTLLVSLAADKLREERVVRPGIVRLERMVAEARERANQETFLAVSPLLTEERKVGLDALLVPDPGDQTRKSAGDQAKKGQTPLSWLRQGATSNTPKAVLAQLEKLEHLRSLGAHEWDLSAVNPNRLKLLARLGHRYTGQALQRAPEERRYPILLAFLHDSCRELVDETVDVFDQILAQVEARARRKLDEFRKGAARGTNEKVLLFGELARVLLDPSVPDEQVRTAAHERVGSPEQLLKALRETERLARPLDDNYFDFLAERYIYLRRFVPTFLKALAFRSSRPTTDSPTDLEAGPGAAGPSANGSGARGEVLLQAVAVLEQLNASGRRAVPAEAPVGFVPPGWRPYVVNDDGRIDRRYWELCLLRELRGALRSGDVWVDGGRRYADPQTFLIPKERWPSLKPEVRQLTGTSTEGKEHLSRCREELESALVGLEIMASRGNHRDRVMEQAGKLIFPQDPSERELLLPEGAAELRDAVAGMIPKVELTDLLFEVDSWTGFLGRLTHAGGSEPRTPDLNIHLHASVLAQATNVGPVRMADLAKLSYRQLAWCDTWYLREETLNDAVAAIANFHHGLPLSRRWGGGTLSSSDGQRFPVAVKAKDARPLPRYFGYGKGLTYYTWTSDQFSQYGTKMIPSTIRDATYVLDGILGNETDLPVAEHTVDTHGFTEIVFALFGLLGLRFSPRISDIDNQILYGMDGLGPMSERPYARRLLKNKIDEDLILRRWDDMLRVAGSLKLGWSTASLLVERLQAKPRKGELARALQEYGRLRKTIFLLRYAQEPDLRQRIGRQLNKGESLHALRRFLLFAGRGKITKKQPEGQDEQALCLNLVTNAVVAWNTVYAQEALTALRQDGFPVRGRDLAHLSPTLYEHINPYGRYHFDPAGGLPNGGLRPLRRS